MTTYTAEVNWSLGPEDDFGSGRYSRRHTLHFDGGATIAGSASPHVVGPWADEAAVDPEEMLVAALSSCHMLLFLHLARQAGFAIASYNDRAEGTMSAIAPERLAVTQVTLRPIVEWVDDAPDAATVDRLHHEAHDACFIANSVKTAVRIAREVTPAISFDPNAEKV